MSAGVYPCRRLFHSRLCSYTCGRNFVPPSLSPISPLAIVYYETDAAATQTQGLSRQDCATTDQPPVQCNTTNTPNDWQGCDAAVLPVAAGIRACGEIFSIAGVLVGLFGGGITGTGKGGFGVIMYTPATLCCGSEGARGRRTCCMTIGLVICSGIALLLWAMLLAIPCLVTGGLIGFLVFSSHGLRLISTVPAACVGFPQAQWEVFERVVNFTFCLNIPPLVAVGCGVVVACANGVARLIEKHNERNTPAWV